LRFWDASAIVPLLTAQAATDQAMRLWREDSSVVVWWATMIECASALGRLTRERKITREESSAAAQRLRSLAAAWSEIEPSNALREVAVRLVDCYPLRAADALQLAAAVFWHEQAGLAIPVVSFDDRLLAAARAEKLVTIGTWGGA